MTTTPSFKSNQSHVVCSQPLNPSVASTSIDQNLHNHLQTLTPLKEIASGEHLVEVVDGTCDHPNRKDKSSSILQINLVRRIFCVREEFEHHDFNLDEVSLSEEEDLDAFYKKFEESKDQWGEVRGKL